MDETRGENPENHAAIGCFQETFLAAFSDEEGKALLRMASMLVPEAANLPGLDFGMSRRQWEAVGTDLRYLEAYLEELAEHLHETIGAEAAVCAAFASLAERRAIEVGTVAEKLEPYKGIGKVAWLPKDRVQGPGGWEGDGGFYESFLVLLGKEEADALRRVASMVFAYSLDNRPTSTEGEPFRQWRAVAIALRHLERCLARLLDTVEQEYEPMKVPGREYILPELARLATLFENESRDKEAA
jgi:hypothetical protein